MQECIWSRSISDGWSPIKAAEPEKVGAIQGSCTSCTETNDLQRAPVTCCFIAVSNWMYFQDFTSIRRIMQIRMGACSGLRLVQALSQQSNLVFFSADDGS